MPAEEMHRALLVVRGATVRFGGHTAVNDVDLEVDAGAITGLIGPNGAGKTTLFNVITGLQDTVSGRVMLSGRDLTGAKAHVRARQGIARTFQRLEVFGSLTARENLLTAAEIRRSWARDAGPRKTRVSVHDEVDHLLDLVGIRAVADERVDAMPTGLARLVELGRALATRPKVLLLDEPASGLDDSESDSFAELLCELADEGMAILLVEHDVHLVMRVCATINVLDFGAILARGTPEEIQQNQSVLDAYLGTAVEP
jgi:branched-chain amino acid transport system ATP-binding protein